MKITIDTDQKTVEVAYDTPITDIVDLLKSISKDNWTEYKIKSIPPMEFDQQFQKLPIIYTPNQSPIEYYQNNFPYKVTSNID